MQDLQRNFLALKNVLLYMVNGFIDYSIMPDNLKADIVKQTTAQKYRELQTYFHFAGNLPYFIKTPIFSYDKFS